MGEEMFSQWDKELRKRSLIVDMENKNPDDIFEQYFNLFKGLNLHEHEIKIGDTFCRGRKGRLEIPGAIDDCNTFFTYPYYGEEIGAPPPIKTSGGRFNRDGYSYLYLSSNEETCAAEIHLEVNQICSIAKFKCVKPGRYLRLIPDPNYQDEYELPLYEILTQPIHDEIRYMYHVTQLFSDIIKQLDYKGIYFKSTQTEGYNIICFYPEDFEYVNFSERMFTASKVQYTIEVVQENYKEYHDYRRVMSSYNSDEDDLREKQFDHISERIAAEDQEAFSRLKHEADIETRPNAKARKYNKLVEFASAIPRLRGEAYILRGTYRIKSAQKYCSGLDDLIEGLSGPVSRDEDVFLKTVEFIKAHNLMPDATDSNIEQQVKAIFRKRECHRKKTLQEFKKFVTSIKN